MNSDEIVARLLDLREQAEAIQQQISELTSMLLAGRSNGEQIKYNGRPVFQVTVSRLFDKTKAAQVLSEQQQQQISKLVLDSTLARQHLDPDTFAACQKESAAHLRPVAS